MPNSCKFAKGTFQNSGRESATFEGAPTGLLGQIPPIALSTILRAGGPNLASELGTKSRNYVEAQDSGSDTRSSPEPKKVKVIQNMKNKVGPKIRFYLTSFMNGRTMKVLGRPSVVSKTTKHLKTQRLGRLNRDSHGAT